MIDESKPLALLRKIAADVEQSASIRSDAMRLLQIADIRPQDFPTEYAEFESWRRQFNPGTKDE